MQSGTSTWDDAHAYALDAQCNVHVTGFTEGSLGGPNMGGEDAFVARFDASGAAFQADQFGTAGNDEGRGITADVLGNRYVAWTAGSSGSVTKLDAFGTQV